MLGHGISNSDRGKALKLLTLLEGSRLFHEGDPDGRDIITSVATNGISEMAIKTSEVLGMRINDKASTCNLCLGIFNSISDVSQGAIETLQSIEFNTFLVGITGVSKVEEMEDELRAKHKIKWGENIRNELSREIGKKIMLEMKKKVNYKKPDVLILVNPFQKTTCLSINPIFIYGRYRKLVRGIPQTRWHCAQCKGKGCQGCGWTGKKYAESVEEYVSKPLLRITRGEAITFHTIGREEIDSKVLGRGIPFIVEVKKPRRRILNLTSLEKEINAESNGKIEVDSFSYSTRDFLANLKKTKKAIIAYRSIIEFEEAISDDLMSKLISILNNKTIQQTVYSRGLANKRQKRKIYGIELKRINPTHIEMIIKCQIGLHVKELIAGDGESMTPSFTEITGIRVRSIKMDIVDVSEGSTIDSV